MFSPKGPFRAKNVPGKAWEPESRLLLPLLLQNICPTLPVAQQEAINLAFFRGMSQREIAAKTNTPLGTVKTRLELGLKKIYDGLKELRDEL